MQRFTTSLYAAAAVALALAVTAPAHAAAITGTNLDFEATTIPPLPPNSDTDVASNVPGNTTTIPGWTINAFAPSVGNAGVWAPQAGGTLFTSPKTWDGNQVGFLQTNSNISQNLNGVFTGIGGMVSVNLLIGETLTGPLNPLADSITLLANGTAIASETLNQALGALFLTPGAFDLNTFNFAISSGLAATLTGQTLGLEIGNDTDLSTLFVDSVGINGGAVIGPGGGGGGGGGAGVPEPSTLSILGIALLGFGFTAWRRSGKATGSSFSVAA